MFLTVSCTFPHLANDMAQVDRPAVNGRYSENTTANFTCNDNYAINGHNQSSCQAESATWNPPIPTCVPSKVKQIIHVLIAGSFRVSLFIDLGFPYFLGTE